MAFPTPPPKFLMSISPPPPLASTIYTAAKPASCSHNLTSIGFRYAIATALGLLVLLSTIVLSTYICCRFAATRRRRLQTVYPSPNPNSTNENIIYIPRVIIVVEDDDSESQNVVVGLDEAVINSYPKLKFSKRGGNWSHGVVCSICLREYRESEMLMMLPDCRHCFHLMCVDEWLKLSPSCPVCRCSPLATPL